MRSHGARGKRSRAKAFDFPAAMSFIRDIMELIPPQATSKNSILTIRQRMIFLKKSKKCVITNTSKLDPLK